MAALVVVDRLHVGTAESASAAAPGGVAGAAEHSAEV